MTAEDDKHDSDRARAVAEARRKHSERELEAAHAAARSQTDAAMMRTLERAADLEDDSKVHDLRALARKHGLELPASPPPPRPDSGAAVTKPSPAALAASRAEPAEEVDWRRALEPSPVPASAPRILIVDDDPAIASTLADVLREEGYRVVPAADGADGIKRLFEVGRVDVVLLDMQMPVCDGFAFLRMLNASPWATTPVVIISAFSPPRDRFEGDHLVLHKPLDLPRVLEVIREQVRAARGR